MGQKKSTKLILNMNSGEKVQNILAPVYSGYGYMQEQSSTA